MSGYSPDQNKRIVLEAFETLFNKRDYEAAETFWSPDYIQHSAHIPPGRDGLFNLVRTAPPTLRYDNSLIFAQDDLVMLHGRFSGNGRSHNWVAADILIMKNGVLMEHWDVLQDEATRAESRAVDRCLEFFSRAARPPRHAWRCPRSDFPGETTPLINDHRLRSP